MNFSFNNKNDLFIVVQNGTFYYPAYKHYGNYPINVVCDYCNKSNLSCSVGFGDKDLCLSCVDLFVNTQNNNSPKLQDIYKPKQEFKHRPLTRMMQDSVRQNIPHDKIKITTLMMQDSVRQNFDKHTQPNNNFNILTYMMQDSIRQNFNTLTFMKQDSVYNNDNNNNNNNNYYDNNKTTIKPYNFNDFNK